VNVLVTSRAALVGVAASLSFGSALTQPADLVSGLKPHNAQVVQLGTQKSEQKLAVQTTAEPEQTPAPVMVTVQPGDYLAKIAADNNTTVERLYAANIDIERPELIYPTEQLRIPTADETLPDRPLPAPIVAAPKATTSSARSSSTASNAPAVSDGSVWDSLAACEAGGNWAINTGNGYYGGLQFSLGSWRAVGGSGLPSDASRDEQIMRGQMLQARSGWGAWPACSAKLGLR
jgi:resuscitation-promoting factor RpfB